MKKRLKTAAIVFLSLAALVTLNAEKVGTDSYKGHRVYYVKIGDYVFALGNFEVLKTNLYGDWE